MTTTVLHLKVTDLNGGLTELIAEESLEGLQNFIEGLIREYTRSELSEDDTFDKEDEAGIEAILDSIMVHLAIDEEKSLMFKLTAEFDD